MNCSACGADNREGARFCRSCGAILQRDEGKPPPDGQEIAAEEEAEELGAQEAIPEPAVADESVEDGALPQERAPEEAAPEEALPVVATSEGSESEPALAEPGTKESSAAEEEARAMAETEPETGQEEDTTDLGDAESAIAAPEQMIIETGKAGTDPAADEEPEAKPVIIEAASLGELEEYEPLPEPENDVFSFWRDEVELMTPVELGTVIADRFAVVEALDVQEDEILYHAQDLQRCWQCGYDANDPEGTFCGRCGVLMDRRPEVRLLELRDASVEPDTGMTVAARLSHEERSFLLLAEPEPKPEPEAELVSEPLAIRLLAGQRSDAGQVRELDEDSLFVLTMAPTYESRTGPVLGLFVVADGMGGHASGEVASRMALQVMVERVMQSIVLPELAGELVLEDEVLALLRQATIAANDAVYLARQKRESDMGTTLTTAYIRDNRLFVAHVGDCRAYRFNADGLEQLTTDHSVVANMIAEGQIEPEEIYTHPHRSIVTRCIGDKPVVEVDTNMLPLIPGDRVVLCCDGLWEMIRSEGLEDVLMQEADSQTACDLLVQHANAAGGEDNISVIVVQVEAVADVEEDQGA
ncbi:MAG: protein phosphatase 2C domain-containing protein [Anaerolineae bacterium]|jgi:protein phosphatase